MLIEQFQRILHTPKLSTAETLGKTQDLILCTFEEIFPQSFNLLSIQKIYEKVLGPNIFPSKSEIQITLQQQITINYKLTQHFVELIKSNFIFTDVYQALEDQTQRAEATIRSHIKIEQEMKMYLQYLESKIQKMQKQILNVCQSPEQLKKQILVLQNRETILQRQKVQLMKKNEQLQRQVQRLNKQLQGFVSNSNRQSVNGSKIFRKYLNQLSTRHKTHNQVTTASQDKNIKNQFHIMGQKLISQVKLLSYRTSKNNQEDYEQTQVKRPNYPMIQSN